MEEVKLPEPQVVTEAREILRTLGEMIERGELVNLAVYAEDAEGNYTLMQTRYESRHEDAGRLLDLAVRRLAFVREGSEMSER